MRIAAVLSVLLSASAAAFVQAATASAPPTAWCGGTAEEAADRPDAVGAYQVHVIYTYPTDLPDRFAERAPEIATDIASIDLWWRGQDPTRVPTFDLAAFPGCTTAYGGLDISVFRLAQDSRSLSVTNLYSQTRTSLVGAGFNDLDKKYLVYYDGPGFGGGGGFTCGQTQVGIIGGGSQAYSILYLGNVCGQGMGTPASLPAITATHELIHGLNALELSGNSATRPPHACPDGTAHPCDSPRDVLYSPHQSTDVLDQMLLDYGRDDYYAHFGAWWDVQDSVYLSRLDAPDKAAPTEPTGLTATSNGTTVTLRWQLSTDDVGPVIYRVYRNGELVATNPENTFSEPASAGETIAYAVRASDSANHLSPRPAIRFTVGLGIVDAQDKLVQDTVPPGVPQFLRSRKTKTALLLTWGAAADGAGVKLYRVTRDGREVSTGSKRTLTVPLRQSKGVWRVRAIDLGDNVGPATSVHVS